MKTSFVGYLPSDGCLMLYRTIIFLFPMIVLFSLEGVFGGLRFPRVAFFAWLAVLGKIVTMNNLRKHVILVK
jgi:hypothetical protein